MKLKTLPEDFQVEELTDFKPRGGNFAFYRLEKRGIGTPEALQIILRDWNLSRKQLSYGGLKDRHAETLQYLTLHRGPQKDFEDRSLLLTYIGQADRDYVAHDIRANHFCITLRSIAPDQQSDYEMRLNQLLQGGLINYFDNQRFGSLGESCEFIGQHWCLGNYERALFLAIAENNPHDRPREKEQKQILRDHWGDWILCKEKLDRSHRRSVVTYLCDHPTDFKRAVALIRQDLRSIYLAAFQSYLWNRWLSNILEEKFPEQYRTTIDSACGPLTSLIEVADEHREFLQQLILPLPSARQKEWDPQLLPALEKILAGLGMETREIRLKYPRDTFFSKGVRECWLGTPDLKYQFEDDDLHPTRKKVTLEFSLPRGCYATMIVKHVTNDLDE